MLKGDYKVILMSFDEKNQNSYSSVNEFIKFVAKSYKLLGMPCIFISFP